MSRLDCVHAFRRIPPNCRLIGIARRAADEAATVTPNAAGWLALAEAELNLVARGYTNREIAAALVISVKTASVHVSHILRKLDAPNRLEAATIAHRLTPPDGGRVEREA
jgi:DNA-binding NarL/FixJ family response regulator